MTIKHASLIPLIGGETIGQMHAFGSKPDYLLSYSAFSNNDSHLLNYLKDVPYILLDEGGKHPHHVDVVNSVCPCAGLSSLSPSSNSESQVNDWMIKTAQYVLEEVRPTVFWGENAPRFAGAMGKPIVNKLMQIAKANNYTMTIYKTKSLLHGLSQVRERSFYFFWKGMNGAPKLNWYDRQLTSYEDRLRSVSKNATQQEVTNTKIPSKDDPFYRYILEEMHGGIAHQDFFNMIEKTTDVMSYIEKSGKSYSKDVKPWMEQFPQFDRQSSKLDAIQEKLDLGGNIMRRWSVIGKGYTGAFVGHMPFSLVHPDEDRYLTYREAMTLMGMPEDFELLNPKRNLNHVCQNVPVSTATDMATEIKAVLEGKREIIKTNLLYQFNVNKTYETVDEYQTLDEFFGVAA